MRHAFAAKQLEGGQVVGGREAVLGSGDVEADHARVPVGDHQIRDLPRPVEHPHAAQQGADTDRGPRGRRLGHPGRQPLLDGLHDLVQGQAFVDHQLGGVADLRVDDAVGGEVEDVLLGGAQQALAGLHHGEGVFEGGYVAHQVAGVCGVEVPGGERVGVRGGKRVAGLPRELHDGGGAQAPVEVVVQHGLGKPAKGVGVDAGRGHVRCSSAGRSGRWGW
jgi:hypothetical protein